MDAITLQRAKAPAAQVLDHRQSMLPSQAYQVWQGYRLCKAQDLIIAGVYLEQGLRLLADCACVIPQMGFVGGAHFPQAAAALLHNFRNTEGTPDFYQLSPGSNHLTARSNRAENQQHRRRIVVHHHGGFRPGYPAQDGLHMAVSRPTGAGLQVIFQGGIALGGGSGRRYCRF